MGFKYGSLVEDYYTGYRLQCEGWKSIFCNPERVAFLGDAPISLLDVLTQNKRWSIGLLEVTFSEYSPITFGVGAMGPLMGLSYAHYAFWPIWSIPVIMYAFLPQLALLNGIPLFPKVSFYICIPPHHPPPLPSIVDEFSHRFDYGTGMAICFCWPCWKPLIYLFS